MKLFAPLHTVFFLLFSVTLIAQNVSILPTGITPAPTSSHPRISYDQIMALPSPQSGDLVYDLTFNCLRVFNGAKWLQLLTTQDIGQVSNMAWAQGSSITNSANRIVKDANGNLYVCGTFKGTGIFGDTTANSNGDFDIYLAKYSPIGELIWLRTAGSPAGDGSSDIVLDQDGNILMTGYYFDVISFGSYTLSYSGGSDVFVTKYDPSGNVLWAKNAGGPGLDNANTIKTDAAGNVYLGGYFYGTITFYGSGNVTLNSLGQSEGFLTKLDASGHMLWARGIQGLESQNVSDLLIAGSDLVVLGIYSAYTDFGNSNTLNSGAGNTDVFVAKYNTSGTCLAVIGFGGAASDMASRLTSDPNGNIWACGSLYSNATVGSFNLISAGNYDAFVVKLNSTLSILNAKLCGGSSLDYGKDIKADATGNIYLVGSFNENISNGIISKNSKGAADIFISKFTNSGNPDLLFTYGGADYDAANGLVVGSNLYVAGVFSGVVNFGNILTSMGTPLNGFVMRVAE